MISTPVATEEDRLHNIEQRLLEVAALLEPLLDIRAASSERSSVAGFDWAMSRLAKFTAQMRSREGLPWDAADQVAARVMLQMLAQVTAELRLRHAEGVTLLDHAAMAAAEARDTLETLERQMAADGARTADESE